MLTGVYIAPHMFVRCMPLLQLLLLVHQSIMWTKKKYPPTFVPTLRYTPILISQSQNHEWIVHQSVKSLCGISLCCRRRMLLVCAVRVRVCGLLLCIWRSCSLNFLTWSTLYVYDMHAINTRDCEIARKLPCVCVCKLFSVKNKCNMVSMCKTLLHHRHLHNGKMVCNLSFTRKMPKML